jgi:hypothetical protein
MAIRIRPRPLLAPYTRTGDHEPREPPRVSSSGLIVILSGAKLILHVVEAYLFTVMRLLLHAPSLR